MTSRSSRSSRSVLRASIRIVVLCAAVAVPLAAQDSIPPNKVRRAALGPRLRYVPKTSHADTLRGSFTTPGRVWWDVTFYDLHVAISPKDSSIRGYNGITYTVLQPSHEMQIDLMVPLAVDSMVQVALNGKDYTVIHPTEAWQTTTVSLANPADFKVDVNFYVTPEQVDAPAGKGS